MWLDINFGDGIGKVQEGASPIVLFSVEFLSLYARDVITWSHFQYVVQLDLVQQCNRVVEWGHLQLGPG